ncbi:hypothetical protein LOK49_LG07G03317 [Camellia lanceoleosa]|uniref:Uncharacterized protein n=1 Tax=Camellia lanceoleosa TaxID=1840588 RepID=A0ACC0GY78_9ERIC|nr:hypothetical protein LOK49_LG07G03317 [Camellia lanceoleosa]
MENSTTSMSKPISPKSRTVDNSDDEESSWTFYFEDFLCHNNNDEKSSFSSGYENPSLVSDAASAAAAKKFLDKDDQVIGAFSWDRISDKNLSFKKRKTKGGLVNDALEDTASSPVNSPKVCCLNQLDMNQKLKQNTDISEEKGNTSGQTDERSELAIVGRDSDYTELKKRGLRLVPLSMLSNYLG